MRIRDIKKIKFKDVRGLAYCIHGLEMTPERMRIPTINFLIDKFKKK